MKTKILYFSKTGNLKKFVEKLNKQGYNNTLLITPELKVDEKFILLVSTINFGEVPMEYKNFLKKNFTKMIGVAGSGNRNWGKNFAIATDKIAKKFNVPIISKFELSGNLHDLDNFVNKVEELEKNEH
ncbi:MAG: class Ib ribonucleoside-diphosphate reductase assembly flavoprotein NrdI [Mycoplasmataceae bacterium]|nr:class Ib ribonucleoside-diphosphate reductase assembly flavoprotein NrdI [Mycoplasmataceae bacterium]